MTGQQQEMFPTAPRAAAPGDETRRAAAEAIAPRAKTLRDLVLATIRSAGDTGLTADEAAERLRQSPFTIRPRVCELAKAGAVRDGGRRRLNRSKRPAIVWVAAP